MGKDKYDEIEEMDLHIATNEDIGETYDWLRMEYTIRLGEDLDDRWGDCIQEIENEIVDRWIELYETDRLPPEDDDEDEDDGREWKEKKNEHLS